MDHMLLTFAVLSLVVILTPGPTVLLALSNGSRTGLTGAAYGIAGAALSDALLITVAGLGLGALLATSATLFTAVKGIGVAYLLWVGVQMLRSSGHIQPLTETAPRKHLTLFMKSFLVAATNPKGYLFFTAFLPQFLAPSEPLLPQYLTLGLIFIAVDIVVMFGYASLGAKAVHLLSARAARVIDRTCGALLIALAAALAIVRRVDL